jgi:hypothetical protein
VKVATKLPCWNVKAAADDYIDFYLLHSLNQDSWARMCDLGVREWAEKAMAKGKFRYLGFSFHGALDAFKMIVDAYDWPTCQIQYNFMVPKAKPESKGCGMRLPGGSLLSLWNRCWAANSSILLRSFNRSGTQLRCAARAWIGHFAGCGVSQKCPWC